MYKLVDLTDCLVKEFKNLEELNIFCHTVWKLQYLEQAIKLNLSIKNMFFDSFKVYKDNLFLKDIDGFTYIIEKFNEA
jgi:hypothetical protein